MCLCFLRGSRVRGQRLRGTLGKAELAKAYQSIKVETADFTKLRTK